MSDMSPQDERPDHQKLVDDEHRAMTRLKCDHPSMPKKYQYVKGGVEEATADNAGGATAARCVFQVLVWLSLQRHHAWWAT